MREGEREREGGRERRRKIDSLDEQMKVLLLT